MQVTTIRVEKYFLLNFIDGKEENTSRKKEHRCRHEARTLVFLRGDTISALLQRANLEEIGALIQV